MRNLFISFTTALLLILSACTEKEPLVSPVLQDHDLPTPSVDTQTDATNKADGAVNSLYLDCIAGEAFVIRATHDNSSTNSISFEYYDNSANSSTVSPIAINWTIAGQPSQSGSSASTSFVYNNNYQVDVHIAFDDNSVFQDQFCVNINQLFPSAFNVCSNHQSTIGCQSDYRLGMRSFIIVDIIF